MFKRLLIGALFFSSFAAAEVIETENTNNSTITTNGSQTTKIEQPPPSAISPQLSTGSGDLCTITYSGAVQTQILGISAGGTVTEENCIRLKNSKALYDMGMKVAAVSMLCQDEAVFNAMKMAGTPCPYEGKIGKEAQIAWDSHEDKPFNKKKDDDAQKDAKDIAKDVGLGMLGWLLLL